MKLIAQLTIALMFIGGCSAPDYEEGSESNASVGETGSVEERNTLAAEVMLAFGYKPEQFESGEGMATIDDYSAPRSAGGPAGYLLVSIDGIEVKRGGPDPTVEYVPYVWIEQGTHEFVFRLRPEMPSDLGRPERVATITEVSEGLNYRPEWNGEGLDLVVW